MTSSHFLGSKASVLIVISSEDKHSYEFQPLLGFIAQQTPYDMGYPLGQMSRLCLCPRSHPRPKGWREEFWRDRAGARAALLSRSQNTAVTSTPLQPPMPSTAMWRLPWGKSIPSQPDPRYFFVIILNQRVKGAMRQMMCSVWKHCTTRSSENKQVYYPVRVV